MRAVRFKERLESFENLSDSDDEGPWECVIRLRDNYFETGETVFFFRLRKNTA